MQTPCEDHIVSELCWVCAVEDSVRLGLNDRDTTGTLHTQACVWAGRLWLQNVASNDSHGPCPFTPTKGRVAHLEAHLVTFSEKQSKSLAPIMRDDRRGQISHPGGRGWGQQIQHLWAEVTSSSEHAWNQWLLPPIFQRRHGPSSARTAIAKSHTHSHNRKCSHGPRGCTSEVKVSRVGSSWASLLGVDATFSASVLSWSCSGCVHTHVLSLEGHWSYWSRTHPHGPHFNSITSLQRLHLKVQSHSRELGLWLSVGEGRTIQPITMSLRLIDLNRTHYQLGQPGFRPTPLLSTPWFYDGKFQTDRPLQV